MKPKSLLCVPLFGSDHVNRSRAVGRYMRHVDTAVSDVGQPEDERTNTVHLTFLPQRSYEPLVEEDSQQKPTEEKKTKKKEKYKKYKKNVGKALRYSWKCLLLGLQNFTVGYSIPLSAAATFVPDFHSGGTWG